MTIRLRLRTRYGLPTSLVAICLLAVLAIAAEMAWLKTGPSETSAASRKSLHGIVKPNLPVPAAESAPVPEAPRPPRPVKGSVLGQFEVPSLNLSWVVLEGTDDETLERGVGHVARTADLGEAGNIGLAGHRNTHFRKLEWLRRGDEIVLASNAGKFRYRVDYVRIHKPTDVDVLDRSHGPAVTLITCFPFEYVGSAPLRLIIRAVAVKESVTRLRPAERHRVAGGY